MIIRVEQHPHKCWTTHIDGACIASKTTRLEALQSARSRCRRFMEPLPLQPEEIPGELREIARRMTAVGHGVAACDTLKSGWPTAESMLRWAESVAAWADDLEPLDFPPPGT